MTIVINDSFRWAAMNRARMHYREQYGPEFSLEHYQDWMLHEWGIIHRFNSVWIDDEKKYTAFLLRFA